MIMYRLQIDRFIYKPTKVCKMFMGNWQIKFNVCLEKYQKQKINYQLFSNVTIAINYQMQKEM